MNSLYSLLSDQQYYDSPENYKKGYGVSSYMDSAIWLADVVVG
jgi:hypothetical protein